MFRKIIEDVGISDWNSTEVKCSDKTLCFEQIEKLMEKLKKAEIIKKHTLKLENNV